MAVFDRGVSPMCPEIDAIEDHSLPPSPGQLSVVWTPIRDAKPPRRVTARKPERRFLGLRMNAMPAGAHVGQQAVYRASEAVEVSAVAHRDNRPTNQPGSITPIRTHQDRGPVLAPMGHRTRVHRQRIFHDLPPVSIDVSDQPITTIHAPIIEQDC